MLYLTRHALFGKAYFIWQGLTWRQKRDRSLLEFANKLAARSLQQMVSNLCGKPQLVWFMEWTIFAGYVTCCGMQVLHFAIPFSTSLLACPAITNTMGTRTHLLLQQMGWSSLPSQVQLQVWSKPHKCGGKPATRAIRAALTIRFAATMNACSISKVSVVCIAC